MRITIAQLNPVVADVAGNVARMRPALEQAQRDGAELAVFSELFLCGYPPRDLLEHDWFVERVEQGIDEVRALSREYPSLGILFGAPVPTEVERGKPLRNAAVLVQAGELLAVRHKSLLPAYDVFDEDRYFQPADERSVVPFAGERLGIHICEDAWTQADLWNGAYTYRIDPIAELAADGATLFINLSASPFSAGKERLRYDLIQRHAQRHRAPFLYANQVGGNDELVFDGRSVALDGQGRLLALLPAFQEALRTIDTETQSDDGEYLFSERVVEVHDALVLGLRDYMHKCGFKQAVLGLSGGIDSSVTCYLAARALGPENVWGISMPSPYSSKGSRRDAVQLARNLGIRFTSIDISQTFAAYLEMLAEPLAGTEPDVTEENVQARIRGNILMALSNKYGHLVLSTGNKSELAVGYCTLYGDMSGGLAVISDVPKELVYALARYANRNGELIPQSSIDKPPSAELRPNQVDQDTLPPYPILDDILHQYVEQRRSIEEIAESGHDPETVRWVVQRVNANEYKRRQAAPGLRVTSKAFGMGRRMPIAARFPNGYGR